MMTDADQASAAWGLANISSDDTAEQVVVEDDINLDHIGYELNQEYDAETQLPQMEDVDVDALEAANDQVEAENFESLQELVAHLGDPEPLDQQARCLAGTVYFESKGESLKGQLAVAKVVLARRDSHRFPNSICGVVYQPRQFSFVRGGSMPAINTASKAWKNAVAITQIALEDKWESPVEGALFFHARYVSPRWRLKRIAAVDNHIFYQ